MQPNRTVIEKFFKDLLKSTHADAYSGSSRTTTTLKECLGPDPSSGADWVKVRTDVAVRRAQAICDAIKTNVVYFKVRQRLSATKKIVAVVDTELQLDGAYQRMDTKHKTRYRSSLIAKRFADAELLLPSPWNFDTPDASKQVTPSSNVRPSPVTPFNVRGRDLSRSQQPRDRSRSRQPDVISTLQRLIAAGKDTQSYIDSLPSAGDKKAARLWLLSKKGGGALSSKRVSGRAFGGGRKTHRRRKLPKLL
jgi:DNA-binding transcriptional regulator YdaS (Cro superfamily)